MTVQPGQQYGDYVVDQMLGEGGMAVVARAHHQSTGAVVALKILEAQHRADHPGLLDRFQRESEVLEALTSIPYVVGYIQAFRDPDTRADVLVLEYVEGRPLDAVLAEGPVEVATLVEWMGHACHALHDMHEAGYVHRDLKPGNLMLVDDPAMPIRVIDFNSAGAAGPEKGRLTQAQGTFPHTPAYLAPECFDGLPADKSADVYALGITFAELLLGHHPLVPTGQAEPETQTEWSLLHEEAAFPELTERPGMPPGLQAVLADATAKHRRDRIPDAVELWTRLKSVWEEINDAPAPPVVPTLKRGWGRLLLRAASALVLLTLLVSCVGAVGLGITQLVLQNTALAIQVSDAERRATEAKERVALQEQERIEAEALAERLAEQAKREEAARIADQVTPVRPRPRPHPVQPRPQPQPQPQPVRPTPRPVQPTPPPVQPAPRPTPRPPPTRPTPRPQPRPTRPTPQPRPRPTRPRPTPRPRPTGTRPRPTPRPSPAPTQTTPRPRPKVTAGKPRAATRP